MIVDSDKELQSLFTGLQPRTAPPEAVKQKAYEAALLALREETTRRRRRVRMLSAVAAAVLIAVTVGIQLKQQPGSFSIEMAEAGMLELDGVPVNTSQNTVSLSPGMTMHTSQPARFKLGQATDLRLNRQTTVRWISRSSFELEQGAVFIDTRDVDNFSVHTSRGTVSDIGTQFLVTLEDDLLEVAVRSGKTLIESALGDYQAAAGDVLLISENQAISRSEPLSDDRWDWIHSVPRGYEQARVTLLLTAITQDLGLQLEYANPGVEAWVMNLQLHGDNLEGLAPRQALEIVLATSGLRIDSQTEQVLSISIQ